MHYPSRRPDSKVPFFAFEAFAGDGVAHGFFGRKGGLSQGLYAGLNCGLGSGDDKETVQANRALAAQTLGIDPEKLSSLHQIHSALCVDMNASSSLAERPKADACVTAKPGIALSILTADCAPVLFSGRGADGKPVIAAAHAGWRGAFSGVLEATVDKMTREYGVDINSIRAAVGPCINKKSYEVSDEFYENFLKASEDNERFFQAGRKAGHHMFDLPGYCASRLKDRGVGQIYISDADTCANEADFYSYRRTTLRGEQDYGRQISVIAIL